VGDRSIGPSLGGCGVAENELYYYCHDKVAYEEEYAHLRRDLEAIA
jgi:hypothetical protein